MNCKEQQKDELEDKERQQATDSLEHLNAELEKIQMENKRSLDELCVSNVELRGLLEGISDLFKYAYSMRNYDQLLLYISYRV